LNEKEQKQYNEFWTGLIRDIAESSGVDLDEVIKNQGCIAQTNDKFRLYKKLTATTGQNERTGRKRI